MQLAYIRDLRLYLAILEASSIISITNKALMFGDGPIELAHQSFTHFRYLCEIHSAKNSHRVHGCHRFTYYAFVDPYISLN